MTKESYVIFNDIENPYSIQQIVSNIGGSLIDYKYYTILEDTYSKSEDDIGEFYLLLKLYKDNMESIHVNVSIRNIDITSPIIFQLQSVSESKINDIDVNEYFECKDNVLNPVLQLETRDDEYVITCDDGYNKTFYKPIIENELMDFNYLFVLLLSLVGLLIALIFRNPKK